MAYRKEVFVNSRFYHVIIRGFNKKPIFLNERDCLRFLISALFINKVPPNLDMNLSRLDNSQIIKILNGEKDFFPELIKKPKPLIKVSSFSLLKNHAHFLIKQISDGGVQKFAHRLQTSFGKFFNIKYKNRGPVFENNFRAVPIMDDRQFRYVVGYIPLNALDTAGIGWRRVSLKESWTKVKRVLDAYPWSSYHYFMGRGNFSALIEGDLAKKLFSTPRQFEKHLKDWRVDDVAHI